MPVVETQRVEWQDGRRGFRLDSEPMLNVGAPCDGNAAGVPCLDDNHETSCLDSRPRVQATVVAAGKGVDSHFVKTITKGRALSCAGSARCLSF